MISKKNTIRQIALITALSFFTPFAFAEEVTPANEITTQKQQSEVIKPKTSFSSVEERRLYSMLQSERENLEEEKKVLALKEKELKTLEKEADKKLRLLDDKLDQLKKVQRKIEELLAEKDVEEVKKVKDLSLIYAKMSPDRAALAMGAVDIQLAADLLANMKVKSAAKILDKMDKAKASQLSTTFTTIQVE
jgi:flagellar motility protein MotE (MotC chaperone)